MDNNDINEEQKHILESALKIKSELLSKVERFPLYQSEKFYGENDTPEKWEHYHDSSDSTNAFFILNKKNNKTITYKLFKEGKELENAQQSFQHDGKIKDAIFSKDGKMIFAIDDKNHLVQWDIEKGCLLYTSPSPRDATLSRMPSSA